MFASVKAAARTFIARRRRSAPIRTVSRVAKFIDEAYENVGLGMEADGELELLRRLRSCGFKTVLDVGANVGDWSVAALRAWPQAHVHAFEVAPRTFAALEERIRAANLSERVTLNACGLGERAAALEMYYYPDHPDLTCDRPRHRGRDAIAFEAHVMTGDEYVERRRLDAVDFIKIDVEGAERQVLQGLSRTLGSGRLRCIQFEYGAFSIDTRVLLADYYALLAPNYWIGKLFPSHVEFRDYVWTAEDFRFANFVCVSKQWPAIRERAEQP
jgi:FkbM family methyltransferase